MLVLGPHQLVPYFVEENPNTKIYNLTSLVEGYEKINILPPINGVYLDEILFDKYFHDFIFNNEPVFIEFGTKILYNLFSCINVYIIVDPNEINIFGTISETLLKIVQCRYGYHGAIVNTINDIAYLNKDEMFNVSSINIVDMDIDRILYNSVKNMSPLDILKTSNEYCEITRDSYGI